VKEIVEERQMGELERETYTQMQREKNREGDKNINVS
jgi:hypothetical protein